MKIIKTELAQPSNRIPHLKKYNKKLCITTQKHQIIIEKSSIIYLKSDSNYCEIHMQDGTIHYCSKTLKNIYLRIQESDFLKVHNSYVVNLSYLKLLDSAFSYLVLTDETKIPISRARKESIKNAIKSKFD